MTIFKIQVVVESLDFKVIGVQWIHISAAM